MTRFVSSRNFAQSAGMYRPSFAASVASAASANATNTNGASMGMTRGFMKSVLNLLLAGDTVVAVSLFVCLAAAILAVPATVCAVAVIIIVSMIILGVAVAIALPLPDPDIAQTA